MTESRSKQMETDCVAARRASTRFAESRRLVVTTSKPWRRSSVCGGSSIAAIAYGSRSRASLDVEAHSDRRVSNGA